MAAILISGFLLLLFLTNNGSLVFKENVDSELNTNFENKPFSSEINLNLSDLTEISPQLISNETQLATLASFGDGLSWETAYVVENLHVKQESTDYGFFLVNLTSYTIIRSVFFANSYNSSFACSIFIENSENIMIENCTLQYSGSSRTYGIKVEKSNQISIQNCEIVDFWVGIDLEYANNSSIDRNTFTNQKYSHIEISNCDYLKCFDNIFFCSYDNVPDMVSSVYFFDFRTSKNCEFRGNEVTGEIQHSTFWLMNNVTLSANKLGHVRLRATNNTYIFDNEIRSDSTIFNDALIIDLAYNTTIRQNLIHNSNYGILVRNCYNFWIENNIFQNFSKNIFEFDYFPQNVFYFALNQTTEVIHNNTIHVAGQGLFNYLPSNVIFLENRIIPKPGYLFPIIFSLICFPVILITYFKNRKKVKSIQQLIITLNQSKQGELLERGPKEKNVEHFKDVSLLLENYSNLENSERCRSHENLLGMVIGFSFCLNYIFSIIFFKGITFFLVIVCVLVFLALIYNLYKVNQSPKVMASKKNTLEKKDLGIILFAVLILNALEVGIIFSMITGIYPIMVLIFGLICIGGFLVNLVLKTQNKLHRLSVELLIIGIIFLVGYFLTNSSMGMSSTTKNMSKMTNLIYVGIILVGLARLLQPFSIIEKK